MWNDEHFRVKVEENALQNFERIMLTSGDCKLFMPMGFSGEGGREYIRYDCSGFAPLSSYKIERTDDALFILENVLLILRRAVEYFIMPERVMITADTVFYNKDTGQVKIAYIPMKSKEYSLKKSITSFIGQLNKDLRDDSGKCMAEAVEYVYYHNYSLREMINKVGMMRRRIYDDGSGELKKTVK